MSAPAFAWAFEKGQELGLTTNQLVLLLYMADQANGAGAFFTGQPRMARYTRLCVRTVRDLVPQLEALGLIQVEAKPGKATTYRIMRQPIGAYTPATAAAPANHSAPANGACEAPTTPANGAGAPRHHVPHHPGKSAQAPRQMRTATPATVADDPSSTQECTLKSGADAPKESKKVLDSEKGSVAETPAAPPKAPVPGTTTDSGASDRAARPPTPDPFDDGGETVVYLDRLRGKRAIPADAPEPDTVTEDDPPRAEADQLRMAGQLASLAEKLARGWQNNYPPRAPQFTPNEQRDRMANKPSRPSVPPEILNAMYRAQGLHRGADVSSA